MPFLSCLRLAAVAAMALSSVAFAGPSTSPAAIAGGRIVAMAGLEPAAFTRIGPQLLATLANPLANRDNGPVIAAYTETWLATLPEASGDAEWECLTQALYFESRGETVEGQFAVAEVILNRVDSPLYPATVCGVVHQGGRGGCQFSFTCDRHSDRIREKAAYRQAGRIARLMLDGAPRVLTDGATHFHTRHVRPGWARKFARTTAIGAHVFYRQPGA